jgi:hypothetical protein
MYPASRESAAFGGHAVPNNFVRSFATDRFPEPGLQQADQPLCHQFSAQQTLEDLLSGVGPAIDFPGLDEDFPRYAGDLVGQRNDDFISIHALLKLGNPWSQWMPLSITTLHV